MHSCATPAAPHAQPRYRRPAAPDAQLRYTRSPTTCAAALHPQPHINVAVMQHPQPHHMRNRATPAAPPYTVVSNVSCDTPPLPSFFYT
eukprot:3384232-Pyramimonas_sp.AAC.2